MVTLAFSFTLQALWLTLSPYSLTTTLSITLWLIILILLLCWSINYRPRLYNRILQLENDLPLKLSTPLNLLKERIRQSALKGTYFYAQRNIQHQLLFLIAGILLATPLYLSELKGYRTILQALPIEVTASYQVIYNNSPYSTTVKLLNVDQIMDDDRDPRRQKQLLSALKNAQLRIYSPPEKIKNTLQKGAIYQGKLALRARYFRSMPGDQQRILRPLARKEIGYGKFTSEPREIHKPSQIENLRQKISSSMLQQYGNGAYMSALSVGKSEVLTQHDWQILRETGTIHLVSISGLHLTLTAFYAFILFRIFFALIGWRSPAPYKLAALIAIGAAWSYATLAGMSLPTIRAAIMFTIAMISLLIEKPIFTLNSVALALLTILSIWPLSLFMPGFWLSFIAVTILTLTARVVSSSLKGLIISQLIISLLLIPLTATFFQEISLISPLINLFAIPWTSLMIMPPLLLGTLLLPLSKLFATPFLAFTNQSITLLRYAIESAANLPYASIETPAITLEIALIGTLIPLWLLALIPKIKRKKLEDHPLGAPFDDAQKRYYKDTLLHTIQRINFRPAITSMLILSFGTLLFILYQRGYIATSEIKQDSNTTIERLTLYQLPVGEGLSFYLEWGDNNLLYDSGNRFGVFDAGRDVIIPFLKRRGIDHLKTLILTQNKQQHIGGTRSLREKISIDQIIAHRTVSKMIDQAEECQALSYHSPILSIQPITSIDSSCAYRILFQNQLLLYLLSDITQSEWRKFTDTLLQQDLAMPNIETLILLYPNQGRSRFNVDLHQALQQQLPHHRNPQQKEENNLHSIILLSTKFPRKELRSIDKTKFYNGYFGAIEIILTSASTEANQQKLAIQVHHYADSERYWWAQYSYNH